MNPLNERQKAFERIYEQQYWEPGHLSGHGSTLEATARVRAAIEKIVSDYKICSMVDVACGDMAWMPSVLERLRAAQPDFCYVGCDIVPALLEINRSAHPNLTFEQLDFVQGPIPRADLILCREALQHLPVRDIQNALKNFSISGAKYLLATIHLRRYGIRNHLSMRPGRCRDRNLLLPPFGLPNPILIYPEEPGQKDKFIGLWELPFWS